MSTRLQLIAGLAIAIGIPASLIGLVYAIVQLVML